MIGVVGLGVVGKATVELFRTENREPLTYDINGTGNCQSIRELAEKVTLTFVCVPTPPSESVPSPIAMCTHLDTSIVSAVCQDLHKYADDSHVTVVRSTVPIGTCRKLAGNIAYNPEFCNARSALGDMLGADRIVIGGPVGCADSVYHVYEDVAFRHGLTWVYSRCGWEDAEAIKLVTNAAMAVKIAFANEAMLLSQKLGANWVEVSRALTLDTRLGDVGWQVPGPDGQMGFGGMCLPKDLGGLLAQARSASMPRSVMAAANNFNDWVRRPKEQL